ncbi:pleiotropic regulatory protein [Ameyamaea chiangmaiensis NBRC 103196]|uniref:DegT/DnrJ/EryC1/StrS family aminotransferase n=1 Tax=Ameyamaea chiangmaiensis TaxID=442969 RepID=A0A850P8T4_9PROT|nr:DegT/DnrJ/EryC1/StrS family aminotransferase [Ameyamaea chiangmaiensis]MBS4074361.1 DegT/DnrJ/EryC1/StrS family aminotransferase [Ameyamaea chiangmaiensis]NVN41025.1 DegT/DnrJ/EryC1/StrS family aminotransferase [Ameyamaea chiangmaiensis]GBQ71778.1 pleiotropic regulatory protein [Ameyamaea chiangmaiensis NBRC 103196]
MTAGAPIAFLDLKSQQRRLGSALRERVDAVFDHCQFVMGPEVAELESRLAAYAGATECVGVSSGTDALQIVMMAEGIGPGDAVFLPAFTYTATAEVPLVLGATPVFVDVDPNTFQIDPNHLALRIAEIRVTGRLLPRAIVGVDLFGQPAPWHALREVAAANDLLLFDDCAQSFGASLDGRKLGREALATTLSFFPSKPLGGYGDGGAILTDDPERAALYRSLRSHGEGKARYEVLRTGMNGRLDTIQAAVLLAKLDVFDEELARRDAIAQAYDAGLQNCVRTPVRVSDSRSAWAIYAILAEDEAARTRLQAQLRADNIPSAIYYPLPLHLQPAYRDHHDGAALPVSEGLARRILALPIHPELTDDEVARVIVAIRQA